MPFSFKGRCDCSRTLGFGQRFNPEKSLEKDSSGSESNSWTAFTARTESPSSALGGDFWIWILDNAVFCFCFFLLRSTWEWLLLLVSHHRPVIGDWVVNWSLHFKLPPFNLKRFSLKSSKYSFHDIFIAFIYLFILNVFVCVWTQHVPRCSMEVRGQRRVQSHLPPR